VKTAPTTRATSRAIRRRSLRLLGSLVSPLRLQLALAGAVLVVSTALQVAGPALIAYGINQALRAFWRRATGCRRS
jgi:ATP-binding cassette subfamily B protein